MNTDTRIEATGRGDLLEIPKRFGPYETLETIGIGSYAVVVRVLNVNVGEVCAAKVMRRPDVNTDDIRLMERELRLSESVECEHLVRCVDVVYLEHLIILVLEHFEGRDLLTAVIEDPEGMSRNWKRIFRQMCLGVQYLHERGLAHRDLKPDNILINRDFDVKLCDYGLLCESRSSRISSTKCGTLPYMSPEMIHEKSYSGRSADIWALGVVLYVVVTGCIPWASVNDFAMAQEIAKGVSDTGALSFEQGMIVLKCCTVNPTSRPKIEEIVSLTQNQVQGQIAKVSSMKIDFPLKSAQRSLPHSILLRPGILGKQNGHRPVGSVLKMGGMARVPQLRGKIPLALSLRSSSWDK